MREAALSDAPEMTVPANLSEDFFLDGKVTLRQPINGYRAAIDPIMLAAAIDVKPGDKVFEAGTGHGAAAICLAQRCANCSVTGIDIQPEIVRLANDNVALNGLSGRVKVLVSDLVRPLSGLNAGAFDHAIANPPFLDINSADISPVYGRAFANVEGEATLSDWIDLLLTMVRMKGAITLIQRADRLDEILTLLRGRAGDIVVFPLWPKKGVPAKRIIIRARKGVRTSMTISPGLVLHDNDGSYTKEADAILRGSACQIS